MQRIAIVGCSGGGKSTLARIVGERLDLPVVHMDTLFWKPGWTEGEPDVFRRDVEAAASADRWVMEGGFITASAMRFARADTIIWIELSTLLCLWRALKRMAMSFGCDRADLAPGCPERFDLAFYRYIWTWNRLTRPRLQAALNSQGRHARLIHLVGRAAVRDFIGSLETERRLDR
jgi:adenylate kinase family enzyme